MKLPVPVLRRPADCPTEKENNLGELRVFIFKAVDDFIGVNWDRCCLALEKKARRVQGLLLLFYIQKDKLEGGMPGEASIFPPHQMLHPIREYYFANPTTPAREGAVWGWPQRRKCHRKEIHRGQLRYRLATLGNTLIG